MEISLIDLKKQYKIIEGPLKKSIENVLRHGQFINGPEVIDFEEKLSAYTNVKHSISCANGTDAIAIALMSLRLKPYDAVFVPAFSYIASVEAISLVGGIPYFVDVKNDYNICSKSLKMAISDAKKNKHHPKVVIPVDLFGKPSISDELEDIFLSENLKVIYDSAQSFGSTYKDKKIGNFGDITTTSFFPAKPLGCYGDGGAIFTNDDNLANTIRSIKNHGMGSHKYQHINIGMNSRLDTLQAAILIHKLTLFDDEIKKRNEIAKYYNENLKDYFFHTPELSNNNEYVWAQYTLRHKDRDRFISFLKSKKIATAVYYPLPLHKQPAYKDCNIVSSGLAKSERFSNEVFSIPMSPYLTKSQQNRVIESLLSLD